MKPILALSIVALLLFAACGGGGDVATAPTNGTEVVGAMQETWAESWYQNLTFVQTTINYPPNGQPDTTLWYEALSLPGKLRIDIADPTSGNTWIFRNDSIYVFNGGQLANAVPTLHPLLLLGFDVYHLPHEEVVSKLDTLGFDLERMYTTEWQGREVYAIGADAPGTDDPQFWIDSERMVFVRLFQNVGPGGSIRQDIQFNAYEPAGDAWIAPEVLFYADSTLALKEIYEDVRVGVDLDPALFEPSGWEQADHWAVDEPGE